VKVPEDSGLSGPATSGKPSNRGGDLASSGTGIDSERTGNSSSATKQKPSAEQDTGPAEASVGPATVASPVGQTPSDAGKADSPVSPGTSLPGKTDSASAKPPELPQMSPQPAGESPWQSASPGFVSPPPDSLYEPRVVMSQGHRQLCLLGIGDTMPDFSLTDLAGQTKNLAELLGDRYTVLVFWSTQESLGREQFRRLENEVLRPFRAAGIAVVAVNVGDDEARVRQECEDAQATCVCLLDKDRSAFSSVATAKLPRTYLLDPRGKVLWFDIEYSRPMRRELRNAIYFFLQKKDAAS